MIEITVRVKNPAAARALARMLREAAEDELDAGQCRHWRGAARRLEEASRPFRYTPRVQRPTHAEIDDEAVRRVVRGEHPLPLLTRDEARLACWHLTVRGCSAPEIAERVKVAPRTVVRWRREDQGVTS
jgi:ATP/maltotriose-dependent transcriptional regulator MalT